MNDQAIARCEDEYLMSVEEARKISEEAQEAQEIVAKHNEVIRVEILRSIAGYAISIKRIEDAKKALKTVEHAQHNVRQSDYTDITLLGAYTALITALAAAYKLTLLDKETAERVKLPTAMALQYTMIDDGLAVEYVDDNNCEWRIESRKSPALDGDLVYELYRDEALVNMRESTELLGTFLAGAYWSVKF